MTTLDHRLHPSLPLLLVAAGLAPTAAHADLFQRESVDATAVGLTLVVSNGNMLAGEKRDSADESNESGADVPPFRVSTGDLVAVFEGLTATSTTTSEGTRSTNRITLSAEATTFAVIGFNDGQEEYADATGDADIDYRFSLDAATGYTLNLSTSDPLEDNGLGEAYVELYDLTRGARLSFASASDSAVSSTGLVSAGNYRLLLEAESGSYADTDILNGTESANGRYFARAELSLVPEPTSAAIAGVIGVVLLRRHRAA